MSGIMRLGHVDINVLNIDESIYKILEWNYLKKKAGVYETSVKQIKDYFRLY